MKETSKVRKIAFLGDHLPRKCGIATFTSNLLAAVAAAQPRSQCFCVSVNDIKGGYEYPEGIEDLLRRFIGSAEVKLPPGLQPCRAFTKYWYGLIGAPFHQLFSTSSW
jgi:hypothetical protein